MTLMNDLAAADFPRIPVHIMFDPRLYVAARKYANKKGMAMSRFVQEAVVDTLIQNNALNGKVIEAINRRVGEGPGRKRRRR